MITTIVICLIAVGLVIYLIYTFIKDKEDKKEKLLQYMKAINLHSQINKSKVKDVIDIPVFYINLDRSKDRKELMEQQSRDYGVEMTRISAVDGKKITNLEKGEVDGLEYINEFYKKNRRLTPYEIACTLSHIKAIQKAYNDGLDKVLIIEDDCGFQLSSLWAKKLSELIQDAPKDWEILQLFNFKCNNFSNKFVEFNLYSPCYSTAAYVINRKGMEKFLGNPIVLKAKDNNPFSKGTADRYIYDQAKTYVYTNSLFIVLDSLYESEIHSDHRDSHMEACDEILWNYRKYNKLPYLLFTYKLYEIVKDIPNISEFVFEQDPKYLSVYETTFTLYTNTDDVKLPSQFTKLSGDGNIYQHENGMNVNVIFKPNTIFYNTGFNDLDVKVEKNEINVLKQFLHTDKKKTIWLYWENKPGKTKPPYTDLCLKSVKKHCSNTFNVILLNDNLVKQLSRYIHPNFTNMNPIAMRADYIRFVMLYEYGGVWLDSDVAMLKSPDFLLQDLETYEFVGFYVDNPTDISISFFACNPYNRICDAAIYQFEHEDIYRWKTKKSTIKWGVVSDYIRPFIKRVEKMYPNSFKGYPAKDYYQPIGWKKSEKYFWSKGVINPEFLKLYGICLNNDRYTSKQKKMTEEEILSSDYRIGDLFRKIL